MSSSDNQESWKFDYIDLLNKPTFEESRIPEAQALKIENAPPFLRRYRTFNDNAVSELLEGYVWLSHPDDYNDPFDSALHISEEILLKRFFRARPEMLLDDPALSPFLTSGERDNAKSSTDPFKTAYQILQAKGDLPASVTADEMFEMFIKASQAVNTADRANRYSSLKDTIRIACFCENYSTVLMWSHYARYHTGICIEYPTGELFKNPEIRAFLNPVIYKAQRFDSTDHFDPLASRPPNILSPTLASCHKSPDWAYEKEWRLVVPFNKSDTDQRFSIKTRPSRILVGAKMAPPELEKIKDVAARISVPIAVGELSETTFDIAFR